MRVRLNSQSSDETALRCQDDRNGARWDLSCGEGRDGDEQVEFWRYQRR